ncbi:Miniconductance mechanosensitive channel MscM [Fundidesulfovibrio magnetotacticus]|uniref:Miniconductance mechanosensitive channel MscM n=1 Tax=Fundidesulfovibrio magnetotacticus TaxID=2730080 RepID=A0A6V8LPC6_9BACT|nr:mechanosensitive ion channel family protein [Fundidesulfovibrio magnetotacticus]GFK92361.1 Miniconductance mechanosensitive channel MscM [Fundidesulfovibrio magnetotacticus]
MTTPVLDLLHAIEQASPSSLTLVGVLCGAALLLHILQLRFAGKGAAGALSLFKWLLVLAALRVLEVQVLRDTWATFMMVLHGVVIWLAFRAILHDLYAGVWLARIQKRPPNRILLNLLSFAMTLFLVAYGLRSVLGVDVSSLLTSSAILTAVVGFSMQDTIGSLFSGLLIQTEKPFKIGDWIKVGELEGQVTEVTWRYTKLTTFAGNQVLLPNNAVAKERVVNFTEPFPEVSLVVPVPAPLAAPPVRVKSSLEEVLRKAPLVSKNRAPRVRLAEITLDHALYRLVFYVDDYEDVYAARSEVLSAVWYEFHKQGIEFPMARRRLVTGPRKAPQKHGDLTELLSGVGLLEGMREDELELIVQCAAVRTYPPGASIVEQGQGGTTMFLIAEGEVAVARDGRELTRLGQGDLFGEMALLTGEPRQADVTAVTPVRCLELDREAFRGVMDKNPQLVANVTRVFQEREAQMRQAPRPDGEASAQGLFDRFRRIFW